MSTTAATAERSQPLPPNAEAVESIYSKVNWRILPLLLIAYMIAYLDRINIGYAQLQMKQTLPFGDAVYGLGAGIFFVGYFLFEVPSNLLLERIGARKTLLRIMVLWGLTAAAMMFVTTPTQFYIARFLLGVFEAGFFPGIILYFTYWYPSVRRGQVIAIFMSATTIVSVIAGPLCGAILKYFDGMNGWHGWQWLFLVQGLPAAILGVIIYFYLQDKPVDAHWLSSAEKNLLRHNLEHDEKDIEGETESTVGQMIRDPKVYLLALVYFLLLGATYTMVFWLPTLIQSWGVKDLLLIGIYSAIPNAIGIVGMILIGRSSDKHHERRWHFAACVAVAAVGLWITTLLQGNLVGSIAALSFAVIGIAAATPLFFTLITEYLSVAAAAAGIALISSLGNLGPAVSPSINGLITQYTGNNTYSMYLVMALYVLAGVILLVTVKGRARDVQPQRPRLRVRLVHLGAGELDHLAPFLGLVRHQLAEVGGRARQQNGADLGEPRLCLGIGEDFIDRLVEPVDDFRRRVLRRRETVPGARLVARQEIGDQRQVRQHIRTRRAGDRKAAQLAGFDVLGAGRKIVEHHMHLAGEHVGERRRAAAIGHMLHVDPGQHLEQFARHVDRRPVA